jgi:hypothetical protein
MKTRNQTKIENRAVFENSKRVDSKNEAKAATKKQKREVQEHKAKKDTANGQHVIETGDSRVFNKHKHDDEGSRERALADQVDDTAEDAEEGDERADEGSQQVEDRDPEQAASMQLVKVAEPARVTIKDIINSHRSDTKRKRKVDKIEKVDSPKTVEASATTKNTEVVKSAPIHKRIIIVNGKPQIDQSSLMIEESQFRKEEDDPRNFKVINEDEYSSSNSVIYAKRSHTKKWTPEETEFFYKCLEECGTDFSMIESKFNGTRNRTQIKNKFRKEENENSERIDQAVMKRAYFKMPVKKRDHKKEAKETEQLNEGEITENGQDN